FRITAHALGNTTGTLTAYNSAGPTTMYFSVSIADPPPIILNHLPGDAVTVYLSDVPTAIYLNSQKAANPPVQPLPGIFQDPDVPVNSVGTLDFAITNSPPPSVSVFVVPDTCFHCGYYHISLTGMSLTPPGSPARVDVQATRQAAFGPVESSP